MQRILLLEDDLLMQRFVAYALEDQPFCLTCCESVPQAMIKLSQQDFDWILTDLMLPGISGLDFLRLLTERPDLVGAAKVVALSAGIDASVKQQLLDLGVFRQLLKPVSIATLFEVLTETAGTFNAASPHAPLQTAAQSYFDSDLALFNTFKNLSHAQFTQDIQNGDHWACTQDLAALHRLAHSLKSVLLLLGEDQAHAQATALEQVARAQTQTPEIYAAWAALRQSLEGLRDNPRF